MGYLALVRGLISGGFIWACCLAGNVGQILSALFVQPFSRKWHLKINAFFQDQLLSLAVLVVDNSPSIEFLYGGDTATPNENGIVVLNHLSYVDWAFIYGLSKRNEKLGALKFLLKDPIKYIPGFGWGMWMLDWLFMKRNWESDRPRILRALDRLSQDCTSNGLKLWIAIFPEGTRYTPKKLAAAQEFAKKRDLPVPENVLVPRVKGFVTCVNGLREKAIPAIYDVTIVYVGFKGGIPSIRQILFDDAPGRKVVLHLKRIPVTDVPTDEEALGKWLQSRWVEKDKAMAEYKAKGSCEAWGKLFKPPRIPRGRFLLAYSFMTFWLLLVAFGLRFLASALL
eukprot:tig00000350_g24343.t1